ncbi:hypothetical protein VPH35_115402 [Triticum aestivum]
MGAVAPSKASTAPSTRSPLSKISFLPMFLPLSKLALLLRKIPFGIGDEANRFRLIGATQTTGVGRCRRRAAFESHCGLSSRQLRRQNLHVRSADEPRCANYPLLIND